MHQAAAMPKMVFSGTTMAAAVSVRRMAAMVSLSEKLSNQARQPFSSAL
jgi:acyl dehydratase